MSSIKEVSLTMRARNNIGSSLAVVLSFSFFITAFSVNLFTFHQAKAANIYSASSTETFDKKHFPKTQRDLILTDYLDIAVSFKESGEYEKARDIIQKAGIISDDDRIIEYLGKLHFLCGQPKKALISFNNLRRKNWFNFLYLGFIYEDLGKEKAAIDSYSESIELKQNSIAFFRLGKIYRSRKQYKKAINIFMKLIKLDPSTRLAYYYLGECFYESGQYTQAYKFLAKAASFYPEIPAINKKMAAVKNKLGSDFFTVRKKEKEEKRKKIKSSFYKIEKDIPFVKIGLAVNLEKFSFSCGEKFIISGENDSFKGEANKLYTIALKKNKVILQGYKKDFKYKSFSAPLKISSLNPHGKRSPFYVLDVIYGRGNFWHKQIDRMYRGDLEVATGAGKIVLINSLSVEEYLYGILSAEIPASACEEALRAQAVAARTLAFRNLGRHKKEGFDFCADVHCQVYQGMSAETPATNKAVRDTRGKVIVYNNKPIEAFYHSNCGGCLCSDTFGNNKYLTNKIDAKEGNIPVSSYQEELWFFEMPDTFCAHSGGKFRWQRVYDPEDFYIAFGFKLKDLRGIVPKDKGDCFHYKAIDVITSGGIKSLKGGLKIRNYFDKLRSSAFKAELKLSVSKYPQMLFFWGAGFGHGAGLCQEGAMRMAEEGYGYKEIINHYFPPTTIKKFNY